MMDLLNAAVLTVNTIPCAVLGWWGAGLGSDLAGVSTGMNPSDSRQTSSWLVAAKYSATELSL
jgi:hypothetical protein